VKELNALGFPRRRMEELQRSTSVSSCRQPESKLVQFSLDVLSKGEMSTLAALLR